MQRWIFTCLLAGLAMIGPFATDTYLPSFPAIAAHFAISPLLLQQTLSVYLFAYSVMTLFYGTLSDTWGRRPVILCSLALFTLGSVLATCATSFSALLLARAIQGMSAGAGNVIGQAIVRDRFNGVAAQRLIANIMIIFGIAPAIAPVLGGWLHVHFGWRASFAFMGLCTLTLWFACQRYLPESLPREQRQPLVLRAIALNYYTVAKNRHFLLGASAMGMAFGGFALYISSAASFVIHILRLPETAFAWLFVPMIGGLVLGATVNGRMAQRIHSHTMIQSGYLVMCAAALANLGYTYFYVATVPYAVLPIMLYTFGLALILPGAAMRTLSIFPTLRGLSASLQAFIQTLIFAVISGFIAPLLFDSAFKLALGVAACLAISRGFWRFSQESTGRNSPS